MLVIFSLHNLPEGIAVYLACSNGIKLGLPLTFAIALHNIPEGMAVAAAFHSNRSTERHWIRHWNAIKWATLSGLCEPLGALVFAFLFTSYFDVILIQEMLAGVAGIMVYISLVELIPSSLKYISPEVGPT